MHRFTMAQFPNIPGFSTDFPSNFSSLSGMTPGHVPSEHEILAFEEKHSKDVSPPPATNTDLFVQNVGRKQYRFIDVAGGNRGDDAVLYAWTLNSPRSWNQKV